MVAKTVVVPPVADAVADVADDLPALLVAVADRSRAHLVRTVLGGHTMAIVSTAPCPVLVTPLPA